MKDVFIPLTSSLHGENPTFLDQNFFHRTITSRNEENFLLTSSDLSFSIESRWVLSFFSTIDSTTANPKLRLASENPLVFDRTVFDVD